MKVILLEEVKKLGKPGDIVQVADGYFRNYLAPKNLASVATKANLKIVEKKKILDAKKMAKEKESADISAKHLESIEVKMTLKSGEQNQLFGSVTNQQISEYLANQGIEIDKKKIILDEPIKYLGSYIIQIKLHPDVIAKLKVTVDKEQ